MSGSKRINNTIQSGRKSAAFIFLFVLFFMIVGVLAFQHIENWSFIEALYFVSATLTTVGYGDITPVTFAGRLLTVVYMWIGVTVAATAIGLVGSVLLHKKIGAE